MSPRSSLLRAGGPLLLIVALAWAGSAKAQTTTGALAGTVSAQEGGPVAGAVVEARSEATASVRTALTDGSGAYRIESLPPGAWIVVARAPGGAIGEYRRVLLHLQETVQLDFTVGQGLAEHVVVRAETPLVDRRETAGGLRVDGDQSATLPLNGRAFTDLALLDSAVRSAPAGNYFGERASVFLVNGQSGRSNSFLVDGLDNNDQTSNTALNSFFSQQVIQEFVLLTHQYGAEFGRASGGVLNIITRRGANEPAWEAFIQGTRDGWNEAGPFVESLPDSGESQAAVQRFQTGFNAGGPIRKDRAFYFVAYEHQRSDDVYPYTGVDREGVAGGRMIAPSEDDSFFARFDFDLSPSNMLMFRLSADDRTTNGVNVLGVTTPEAGFRFEEQDLSLAVSWTSIVAPNLISETRFLAARSAFDQFAYSELSGVNRPSGVFGGNILNRQLRDEDRLQLVSNFTWRRGTHMMKFGLDVLHSRTTIGARFNPSGSFVYNSDIPFETGDCDDPDIGVDIAEDGTITCGRPGVDDNMDGRESPGSVAFDCLDGEDNDGDGQVDGSDPGCQAGIDEPGNKFGYPVVYSLVVGEPESKLEDTRFAVFGQDRWDVGKHLFVEAGLRYDFSTYRLPSDARVASFIPNGGAGRDYDNISPRLGFTYTPGDGRLVLRGGAGVFYDKLVLAFPATAAVTSGTEIDLLFPQGFLEEFTEDDVDQGTGPTPPFLEEFAMRFSTATELETPYTVQYTLGVERAVGRHHAFRADVIRTLGYHQPLMMDLNPVIFVQDPGFPVHPDPTVGSIAAITTEGRSWYSGVDLKWRTQLDDSWLSASYTWSRAEDLGFDPLKDGVYFPGVAEPDGTSHFDLSGERGPAEGDRRNRLVVSGDFPFPWMGIRASGVLQMSSGIPFNVTTGQDNNLDGILSERPTGVARNQGEDSDLAAINALRASPEVGLPPISDLDEPSFSQVDVRLYKQFPVSQEGDAEVFLQIFNLLDRENAGLIEGRAVSPNLGQVISLAGPPRTLELGLRIGF